MLMGMRLFNDKMNSGHKAISNALSGKAIKLNNANMLLREENLLCTVM